MPPKTASARKQASIKSFDKFRVAKPVPKSSPKNEKPALLKKTSDVDVRPRTTVTESSDDLRPIDITLSSDSNAVSPPASLPIARPQLDESHEIYISAAKSIRDAKRTAPLHVNPNTIETILRDFDMTGKYGPCVGITRLERFNRAMRMKMNPPKVIGQILETQQAHDRSDYRNEIFYGRL